jgi:hypothetical protein
LPAPKTHAAATPAHEMVIPIRRPGLCGPRIAHPCAGVIGPGKLFFVSFSDFKKFYSLKILIFKIVQIQKLLKKLKFVQIRKLFKV